MDAKELRIGNLVEKNDRLVHQITIDDLIYLSRSKEDIIRIHPIPVTEEWLPKFGFSIISYIDGTDVLSYKNADGDEIRFFDGVYNFFTQELHTGISVEFVHKLQNLYFALRNEELEIK